MELERAIASAFVFGFHPQRGIESRNQKTTAAGSPTFLVVTTIALMRINSSTYIDNKGRYSHAIIRNAKACEGIQHYSWV